MDERLKWSWSKEKGQFVFGSGDYKDNTKDDAKAFRQYMLDQEYKSLFGSLHDTYDHQTLKAMHTMSQFHYRTRVDSWKPKASYNKHDFLFDSNGCDVQHALKEQQDKNIFIHNRPVVDPFPEQWLEPVIGLAVTTYVDRRQKRLLLL